MFDNTTGNESGTQNFNQVSGEERSIKTENKFAKTVPFIEVQQTHFDEIEKSKNVLLLSMSTLPPAGANYCMVEKEGNTIAYHLFSGDSQLEPGTKFFISKLAMQGKKPDKIIVLTTEETLEPDKERGGKVARDIYAENVIQFIQEGDHVDEKLREELHNQLRSQESESESLQYVKISEKLHSLFPKKGSLPTAANQWERLAQYIDIQSISLGSDALQEVIKSITELSKNKHVNLFLDLQGGSRSFMFTMFAAVTLLRDKNITIKDAFATKFHRANKINPMETVLNEFAILDLVSGIRAFSHYGKVEELQRFLETRNIEEGENERKLLKKMKRIDECMQINNPMGFTNELDELRLNPNDYSDNQFKLVVEDLRSAYDPLLDSKHTVLDQIKWLEEKSFLASALTFIEAKIPDYIVNNSKTNIITIDCKDFSDEQIQKQSGGQAYYSSQTNLFNFELKRIIENIEKSMFKDVWKLLAEKIVSRRKEKTDNHICVSISEKVLNMVFKNAQKKEKEILLKIESEIGNEVYREITYNDIVRWTKVNWEYVKKKVEEKTGNRIYKENTISGSGLEREVILKLLGKWEHVLRLNAVKQYLHKNSSFFDIIKKDNLTEEKVTILKSCITHALNCIWYESETKNNEYYKIMELLLKPMVEGTISDLVDIKNGFGEIDNNGDFKFKDKQKKEEFQYELWKQLMTTYVLKTDTNLDEMAEEYVLTPDKIDKLEQELGKGFNLQNTIGEPTVSDSQKLKKLMSFARNYTECRNAKKDMDDNKRNRIQEKNCSFRNIDMYLQLGNTNEEIKAICEEYFYISSDHKHLTSIAGVKNPESKWAGAIKIKRETDEYKAEEYREILDTCICFYQALKVERNVTNHAAEKGNAHMEYRYTQKGIEVFVELCRKL